MSGENSSIGTPLDGETIRRVVIGSLGALSGAAIAVGVPLIILHYWGHSQWRGGNFERALAMALVGAIALGSLTSILSVFMTTRKRKR